ncbi:MAG: UDP-N-acetylmuramate--L-alanine ligase [Planctomycetes bacterium]|nr:UDP-N-acetylmuramate--L-alanine ligase [Planctomycetota bacterium]
MISPTASASTAARTRGLTPGASPAPVRRKISSIHLVGICGSGMKALAELAGDLGWRVSGSDLSMDEGTHARLAARGLVVHRGHHPRFLPDDVDVLVHSPAVGLENPERRLAAKLHIPQLSYSRMLGLLMRNRVGVSIAGTHGKSTTTAMTATILGDAGLNPSAIVGAELRRTGRSGWAAERGQTPLRASDAELGETGDPQRGLTPSRALAGKLFVVESCEFRKSFLDLSPKLAVITGIEPDHFDCYATLDDAKAAFAEFTARLPADGGLIVRGDCRASLEVAQAALCRVQTYSLQAGSDWWAADLKPAPGGQRFRVFFRGNYFSEIYLPLYGTHNVLNALAACAVCRAAGASAEAIRESLAEFAGIRRRFEPMGTYRGMTLVDDYAHHPTAVAGTLACARQAFGRRRLKCVFQPHQVSRTRALMAEFARSFAEADELIVLPVFAARESAGDDAIDAARELTLRIAETGTRARFAPSLDRLGATLDDEARPGDVLLTMGAGDIDRVHHEFARRLQGSHAAG